jgi:hypothetical protein
MEHLIKQQELYFGEFKHHKNTLQYSVSQIHQYYLNHNTFSPEIPENKKTNRNSLSVGFFLTFHQLKNTNK